MKTVSGYIFCEILGLKINGQFPDIRKSVLIFAPHTSYYDAFYGKLLFKEHEIKHVFLSKKELFFFQMNIFMKWFGSIPVRGVTGEKGIYQVAKMLQKAGSLHINLSHEGTFTKVSKWEKGFYYMSAGKRSLSVILITGIMNSILLINNQ